MQYTLRNVPSQVDRALRRRAQREQKSLNEVTLEALSRGLGLAKETVKQRSLGEFAGTWEVDASTEEALREQRSVDPELWA